MQHSFDIDIAKKYGVVAAILLSNFLFWICQNKAKGKHFHDGRTWTYSSIEDLCQIFPYLTNRQIRTGIDKLLAAGVLVKANHNQKKYDRTSWYAVIDESPFVNNGKWICQKRQMELSEMAEGFVRNDKPVPDSKPDINTDKDMRVIQTASEITEEQRLGFERFWQAYPRKADKAQAQECWCRINPNSELIAEIVSAVDAQSKQWADQRYIPFPAKWLSHARWKDEIVASAQDCIQPARFFETHPASANEIEELINKGVLKIKGAAHGKDNPEVQLPDSKGVSSNLP